MAPNIGILLNGPLFPNIKPFPAVPLTNLVLIIPHLAHLHFIILRPFWFLHKFPSQVHTQ